MTTDAPPSAPTDNSETGTGPVDSISTGVAKIGGGKRGTCDELAKALSDGDMPQMVAAHTKLILQYYEDVQAQAAQSFSSAKFVAIIGFAVLVATLVYTFFAAGSHPNTPTVGAVGVASGALIEFIAGVNFWLYSRAAKQFAAFHICLERTHRYLIAYQVAGTIARDRDRTLHNLVCIMANAPMIRLDGSRAEDDPGSQLRETLAPAPRREPADDGQS